MCFRYNATFFESTPLRSGLGVSDLAIQSPTGSGGRPKGNALRPCVQHDAANEFLPCLFGEKAETLKVMGGWTGRFFNFDSDEMAA